MELLTEELLALKRLSDILKDQKGFYLNDEEKQKSLDELETIFFLKFGRLIAETLSTIPYLLGEQDFEDLFIERVSRIGVANSRYKRHLDSFVSEKNKPTTFTKLQTEDHKAALTEIFQDFSMGILSATQLCLKFAYFGYEVLSATVTKIEYFKKEVYNESVQLEILTLEKGNV